MASIKQLNLLDTIRKEHPDGIIEGSSKKPMITLVELGSQNFRSPEMMVVLKRYWKPHDHDALYIINMAKVDVLTPSAAKILVETIPKWSSEFKKPVVFAEVRTYVAEALHIAALTCDPPRTVWIRQADELKLIGKLPGRFESLMNRLEEAGHPCSASHLALQEIGEASKKEVNKLSVYLQEMVNLGLVGRTKENAGETQNRERGWTYLYHRPDDKILEGIPITEQP